MKTNYTKPTFSLYRIIRLEDGRAFQGWNWQDHPYFTNLGGFYRTEETIKKHLWKLVRKPQRIPERVISPTCKIASYMGWSDEIEGEKEKYAVEKYRVLELDKVVMSAATILCKKREAA